MYKCTLYSVPCATLCCISYESILIYHFQVRLFDLTDSGFVYARSIHRQEGRVLSLAWHGSGKYVVAGGADSTLRKIDVNSGVCTLRITLDEYGQRSTLVWDVQFVNRSSIVSADSLGKVQIWDMKHGTLRHSFGLHTADVLALAVWEEEEGQAVVYASGVDSKIVKLAQLAKEGEGGGGSVSGGWVKAGEINVHTHDVRALALSHTGLLASGGTDTELVLTDTDSFTRSCCVKYQPFPCMSRHFKIAEKAHILMYQGSTSLRLWDLTQSGAAATDEPASLPAHAPEEAGTNGRSGHGEEATTRDVPFSATSRTVHSPGQSTPVLFLELKAKPPLHILSSAISSDGRLVALSNIQEMWLYGVEREGPRLHCVANFHLPSFSMLFNPIKPQLVMATTREGVKAVTVSESSKHLVESPITPKAETHKKTTARTVHIEISSDGQYLATISSNWRITLYDLTSGEPIAKLPKVQPLPIVCTFNPSQSELLIFSGGDGQELFSYDIPEDSFSSVGSVQIVGKFEGRSKLSNPLALVPVPSHCNLFAVYDNDCVVMLRRSMSPSAAAGMPSGRKRKKGKLNTEGCLPTQFVNAHPLVLFVGALCGGSEGKEGIMRGGEKGGRGDQKQTGNLRGRRGGSGGGVVVVERPWREVLKSLPPTLLRKRYGT